MILKINNTSINTNRLKASSKNYWLFYVYQQKTNDHQTNYKVF